MLRNKEDLMKQHDVLGTDPGHAENGGGGKHGLLMIVCCIPMLVIAVVLVVTGVVSGSFLIVALACTAMMFFMMRGMHGGANPTPPRVDRDEPGASTRVNHHHGTNQS